MFKEASFRVIPYFISQYLLLFTIVLVFTISNKGTSRHVAKERYCSPSKGEEWKENYDPDYFYHITDVHVTHYIKSSLNNFEKTLKIAADYKAKAVLITGDLVDNYYIPYFPSAIYETKQIQEDWIEYSQMALKYLKNFDKIIESFGNHDIPRILSKNSRNFFYRNYSMISRSHRHFTSPNDTYDVFTDKVGNFTFAILNPMFFPIPPLPFDYYVHAPPEYIDKVEAIINSIPNHENVIVATHFQGPVWSEWYSPFEMSISTNRFFNSILQKKKVKILLTGHNHGAGRMVMHYNDSFEVCASDLRYNLKSGLVTNDNGNVVYHWFSIKRPTKSFVTFPVPIGQTTSRSECGVAKVRVIAFRDNQTSKENFLNKLKNMYVKVDRLKVKLEPVHPIGSNQDLWLLEANTSFLTEGKHKLQLIGEKEENFEFLFGPSAKIESTTELLYDDMMWTHTQWIGLLIMIVMFVSATFPVSLCNRQLDGYWRWINKIDSTTHKEECQKSDTQTKINDDDLKYWLFSIFCGFLCIRSRLLKLPLFLRTLLFVSVVASLFLPVFTFEVGGEYGFVFIFGYFLGQGKGVSMQRGGHYISRVYGSSELRYEEWCPFLGFYYFSAAVVPVILAASSLGLRPKNLKESRIQIIDFLIVFHSFLLLCETKCALMSPFILFPLFWLTILSIFYYVRKIRRDA